MAYNSPVAGSPFDRSNVSRTQTETAAGEFWTIKQNGEDWPLIICDEEMVQKYYVKKQRPANARQPDGTWADGYKTGESRVGQRCYPTLFLGRYKCGWTPWKILEPLDEEIGQVIRVSTNNPLLAEAWREALQYQVNDALSYFKDRLHQQSLERSQSKGPTAATPVTRKRKGTPELRYPQGYRMEEVDDEESRDLFVLEGNNSTPRIKQEFSDPTSSAEMEALYEDTDNTTLPKPVSKRTKTNTPGHFSMPPRAPTNSYGSGKRRSASRATPMVEVKKRTVNDPNRVIIYVDNPYKNFSVKRSGLDASPLLQNLIAYNPEIGWYVMSPLLSTLKEDEFLPVSQYLERGEYDPNILDEGTDYVRLETELTEAKRGGEAVRCATIYSIAQVLELPGLQDLAIRKLKALATREPHHPFAILCVVESIFDQADKDLRQYLVQYLADHYWDLVLAETVKMAEVMRGIGDLEKGVFRLLAGPVETDANMDADVEIKKEDDAKVEVDAPFFSDNVATEEKSNDERTLSDEGKLPGKEKKNVDKEVEKPSTTKPVTASATPTRYRQPTVADLTEDRNKQKEKSSREKEAENPSTKPVTASASSTNNRKPTAPASSTNPRKPTAPSPPTKYKKPTVADLTDDGKEGIPQTQAEMIRAALRNSENQATERQSRFSRRTD